LTSICWDGETLATDSRETAGTHLITNNCKKLYNLDLPCYYEGDRLLACGLGGRSSDTDKILHYFYSDTFPNLEFVDHDAIGIIVGMGAVYLLDAGCPFLIKYNRSQKLAEGSGAPFARSAMMMGLSAVDAIKHAIKLDMASGGKIKSIKL
jgi:hypothetical protein